MVSLNGKTNLEYRCDHIHTEISTPAPKRSSIDIPLQDGTLDLTNNLSSTIFYGDRTIKIGLEMRGLREDWPIYFSKLLEDIHGQSVRVEFQNDPNYYWIGYAEVGQPKDNGASQNITITITAKPFKRERASEEVYSGTVIGDVSTTINVRCMRAYLTFNTSAAGATITYDGQTWSLPSGESTAFGLVLLPGSNALTLHGSGQTISITKTEAML